MSKHLKYLELLFEEAKETDATAGARVAAALVFKKTLVIMGTNSNRTDPLAARFSKNEDATCIHAEVQTIKNSLNHFRGDYEMLDGSTMYICRAKKDGPKGSWLWGKAKPCSGCEKAIEFFGIKKVIYSEEGTGNFSEWDV